MDLNLAIVEATFSCQGICLKICPLTSFERRRLCAGWLHLAKSSIFRKQQSVLALARRNFGAFLSNSADLHSQKRSTVHKIYWRKSRTKLKLFGRLKVFLCRSQVVNQPKFDYSACLLALSSRNRPRLNK